jgi:hypothetical protein
MPITWAVSLFFLEQLCSAMLGLSGTSCTQGIKPRAECFCSPSDVVQCGDLRLLPS